MCRAVGRLSGPGSGVLVFGPNGKLVAQALAGRERPSIVGRPSTGRGTTSSRTEPARTLESAREPGSRICVQGRFLLRCRWGRGGVRPDVDGGDA